MVVAPYRRDHALAVGGLIFRPATTVKDCCSSAFAYRCRLACVSPARAVPSLALTSDLLGPMRSLLPCPDYLPSIRPKKARQEGEPNDCGQDAYSACNTGAMVYTLSMPFFAFQKAPDGSGYRVGNGYGARYPAPHR